MTEQAAPQAPLQIGINAQYLKDLSFESPSAPQIFAPTSEAPAINLGVNVQTRHLAETTHEVLLKMKIEASLAGKPAFIVEIAYGGVFSLPDVLNEDQVKGFLFVDAPHILFPFVRSIIANAVRDGGFPQFLLSPIDFAGLYQANQAQMTATPQGNA